MCLGETLCILSGVCPTALSQNPENATLSSPLVHTELRAAIAWWSSPTLVMHHAQLYALPLTRNSSLPFSRLGLFFARKQAQHAHLVAVPASGRKRGRDVRTAVENCV